MEIDRATLLERPFRTWEHTTLTPVRQSPYEDVSVTKTPRPRLEDVLELSSRGTTTWMVKSSSVGKAKASNMTSSLKQPTPGMLPSRRRSQRDLWEILMDPNPRHRRGLPAPELLTPRFGDTLIDQMTELKVARENSPVQSRPRQVHRKP